MKNIKPILFCKCKMCGSTFLDEYPSDRTKEEAKHIGRWAECYAVTHDCSKGDNPLPDANGVGEILGVIFR